MQTSHYSRKLFVIYRYLTQTALLGRNKTFVINLYTNNYKALHPKKKIIVSLSEAK